MRETRDRLVADALQKMGPPPPGPDFWDDLVARLEALGPPVRVDAPQVTPPVDRPPVPRPPALRPETPSGADRLSHDGEAGVRDGSEVDPVLALAELAPAPPRVRRPGRRRRAALAAAAVLTVAVAAVALVDRGPGGVVVTTPPASRATTTLPEASSPAAEAAWRWIAAVDAGDVDAAWAMVGPQSRQSIGGRPAFEGMMRSALREGWGAWAHAEDLVVSDVPLAEERPDELHLVALHGVVVQEGDRRHRAAVILVRVEGGEVLVEPFVPGPAIDLIELSSTQGRPPRVAPTGPIALAIDADSALVVAVDGTPVPDADLDRDSDGTVTAVRFDTPLSAGRHHIAVGVLTASGALAADVQLFEVR